MKDVTIIELNGKRPRIHSSAFVAPGCRIIGDVEIGPDASVWYNCVIRADVNFVRIGARTNIQDGTVIHVDSPLHPGDAGQPTIIGCDALIGHMAMVHGCVLHDRAFIGMGCVAMDSVIESDGMLGAGALLTPGKRIAAKELWTGRPAKLLRLLTDEQIALNQLGVSRYVENARTHQTAINGSSST